MIAGSTSRIVHDAGSPMSAVDSSPAASDVEPGRRRDRRRRRPSPRARPPRRAVAVGDRHGRRRLGVVAGGVVVAEQRERRPTARASGRDDARVPHPVHRRRCPRVRGEASAILSGCRVGSSRVAPARGLARLVVGLLGVVLLTSCRLDATVELVIGPDGTGTLTVTAVADAEVVQQAPGLAEDLRFDDAVAAGWTVDGPAATDDGGLRVVLSHPVTSAAEATNLLNSLGPPFSQMGLVREVSEDGDTTTTTLTGNLVLTGGFDAFADADLLAAVGGSPYADELAASGATPAENMAVTLRRRAAGRRRRALERHRGRRGAPVGGAARRQHGGRAAADRAATRRRRALVAPGHGPADPVRALDGRRHRVRRVGDPRPGPQGAAPPPGALPAALTGLPSWAGAR